MAAVVSTAPPPPVIPRPVRRPAAATDADRSLLAFIVRRLPLDILVAELLRRGGAPT
jgi:hypothetical protein